MEIKFCFSNPSDFFATFAIESFLRDQVTNLEKSIDDDAAPKAAGPREADQQCAPVAPPTPWKPKPVWSVLVYLVGIILLIFGLHMAAPWAFRWDALIISIGVILLFGWPLFCAYRAQEGHLWEAAAAEATIIAALLALFTIYFHLRTSEEPRFDLHLKETPDLVSIESVSAAYPCVNSEAGTGNTLLNRWNYVIYLTNSAHVTATNIFLRVTVAETHTPLYLYAVAVKQAGTWLDPSVRRCTFPKTAARDQVLTLSVARMDGQQTLEVYLRLAYDRMRDQAVSHPRKRFSDALRLVVWSDGQKLEPPKEGLVSIDL